MTQIGTPAAARPAAPAGALADHAATSPRASKRPAIALWPGEVARMAREAAEERREHGPECVGCTPACDRCPETEEDCTHG